jgi:hypothetical protein
MDYRKRLLAASIALSITICCGCESEEHKCITEFLANVKDKDYNAAVRNATRLCEIREPLGKADFFYREYLLQLGTVLSLAGEKEKAKQTFCKLLKMYERQDIDQDDYDIVYAPAKEALRKVSEELEGRSGIPENKGGE